MTTTKDDPKTSTAAARVVEILKEPVELFKILKFEGLVASGGEAKSVIAGGLVAVNGVVELRKSRKIRYGDTITFAGQELWVRPTVSVAAGGCAAEGGVSMKKGSPCEK